MVMPSSTNNVRRHRFHTQSSRTISERSYCMSPPLRTNYARGFAYGTSLTRGHSQAGPRWGSILSYHWYEHGTAIKSYKSIEKCAISLTKALRKMKMTSKSRGHQKFVKKEFTVVMYGTTPRSWSTDVEWCLMRKLCLMMLRISKCRGLKSRDRSMKRFADIMLALTKNRASVPENGCLWPWDAAYPPGGYEPGFVNFNEFDGRIGFEAMPSIPLFIQGMHNNRREGIRTQQTVITYDCRATAEAKTVEDAGENSTKLAGQCRPRNEDALLTKEDEDDATTQKKHSIEARHDILPTKPKGEASTVQKATSVGQSSESGEDQEAPKDEDDGEASIGANESDACEPEGPQIRMNPDGTCTLVVPYPGGVYEVPFCPGSHLRRHLLRMAEYETIDTEQVNMDNIAIKSSLSSDLNTNKANAEPGKFVFVYDIQATNKTGPDGTNPKDTKYNFFPIPGGTLYLKLRRALSLDRDGHDAKVVMCFCHDGKPLNKFSLDIQRNRVPLENFARLQGGRPQRGVIYAEDAKVKANCHMAKEYTRVSLLMPMSPAPGGIHEMSWKSLKEIQVASTTRMMRNFEHGARKWKEERAREKLAAQARRKNQKAGETGITDTFNNQTFLGKHKVMPRDSDGQLD